MGNGMASGDYSTATADGQATKKLSTAMGGGKALGK